MPWSKQHGANKKKEGTPEKLRFVCTAKILSLKTRFTEYVFVRVAMPQKSGKCDVFGKAASRKQDKRHFLTKGQYIIQKTNTTWGNESEHKKKNSMGTVFCRFFFAVRQYYGNLLPWQLPQQFASTGGNCLRLKFQLSIFDRESPTVQGCELHFPRMRSSGGKCRFRSLIMWWSSWSLASWRGVSASQDKPCIRNSINTWTWVFCKVWNIVFLLRCDRGVDMTCYTNRDQHPLWTPRKGGQQKILQEVDSAEKRRDKLMGDETSRKKPTG